MRFYFRSSSILAVDVFRPHIPIDPSVLRPVVPKTLIGDFPVHSTLNYPLSLDLARARERDIERFVTEQRQRAEASPRPQPSVSPARQRAKRVFRLVVR